MTVLKQTIGALHFTGADIQGFRARLGRPAEDAPVTDGDLASAAASARAVEILTGGLWFRSAADDGSRAVSTEARLTADDLAGREPRLDAVPGYPLAEASEVAFSAWRGGAWTPLAVSPAPGGKWTTAARLQPGDEVRITGKAAPPAATPGAVMDALRRLYNWRVQYEPVRGERADEPVPLGAAMRRSGAFDALAGAGLILGARSA